MAVDIRMQRSAGRDLHRRAPPHRRLARGRASCPVQSPSSRIQTGSLTAGPWATAGGSWGTGIGTLSSWIAGRTGTWRGAPRERGRFFRAILCKSSETIVRQTQGPPRQAAAMCAFSRLARHRPTLTQCTFCRLTKAS
jgi:hypothetical protein